MCWITIVLIVILGHVDLSTGSNCQLAYFSEAPFILNRLL